MELRNISSCPPGCTDVAIRNAATYLCEGIPVRISVGPTKKKGVGHAQAEAYHKGRWVPIVNQRGFARLDESGDGVQTGVDYYLTFTEAVKRWSKPGKTED